MIHVSRESMEISTLEDETTLLFQNVRHQTPISSRRTESSMAQLGMLKMSCVEIRMHEMIAEPY
jgi:hypothetical protein